MDQTFQKRDGMEPAEPQLNSSLAGMSFQMVGDEAWTWDMVRDEGLRWLERASVPGAEKR